MKRLTIGRLQFAAVGNTFFADWRMAEAGNRWRLAIGRHPRWRPLFDAAPRRWTVLGLDIDWYAKGVERAEPVAARARLASGGWITVPPAWLEAMKHGPICDLKTGIWYALIEKDGKEEGP
ncbi:hypothetical protein [Antribacter gilvus]|uniref:hypothetical protein n=1 Tax=Antribacter gilvus TaxID=2304675 RepID=UPI000F792281|nr:hypothetical protein [Antribacter gilvus]